jgi:glycosyltransferase involved in cell wall biosynthesis
VGLPVTGSARVTAGGPGRRVVFFGTFYPTPHRAGNSSTGIVTVLSRSPSVGSVSVYAPRGSRLPPAADASRLRLRTSWSHDDLPSLIATLVRMIRDRGVCDVYVFNIYVTSFGRRPLVNAFGLMMPVALARLARRPVRVYMHNFLETQDVEQLGYRPSRLVRRLVRALEAMLVRSASVVVPLTSQRSIVEEQVGGKVDAFLLPYIEAVPSVLNRMASDAPMGPPAVDPASPVRVLLFGAWGPQKDLTGALRLLDKVAASGVSIRVTIAGGANPSFPDYATELAKFQATFSPERFRFLGWVSEDDVLALTLEHDLLFLPYRATGGYSGAMSCGALTDLPVVSYDLPQIREFGSEIGVTPAFIDPTRADQLAEAIAHAGQGRAARQGLDRATIESRLRVTQARVERLASPAL